jgi:hypothetical protein
MQLWDVGAVRGMDGVLVKGVERVQGAGARRLVLRLVRPDEEPRELLDLFERAQQSTRIRWKNYRAVWLRRNLVSGPGSAPNHKMHAVGNRRLAPNPRLLHNYRVRFGKSTSCNE